MIVLLLLATSIPVGAQNAGEALISDQQGDVSVVAPDGSTSAAIPAGAFENMDLVEADIWHEDESRIALYATVTNLEETSDQPVPFSDPYFFFSFRYGEQGYRVMVVTALGNPTNGMVGNPLTQAWVQKEVAPGSYRNIADAEAEIDFGQDLVVVSFDRAAVRDENNAPLARDRTIDDFRVRSRSLGFFQFPLRGPAGDMGTVGMPALMDWAPAEGPGPSYVIKTGTELQRGTLFATTDEPVRWTNGEATTLAYHVQVTNVGDKLLDAGVEVSGTDPSWTVAHSERVRVAAQETINVTILVSIPFVHQHGKLALFTATFDDGRQNMASTELGIYWPRIPQPAGHHDTVWFHGASVEAPDPPFDTAFPNIVGWFNPAEPSIDEADEGAMIPADYAGPPGVGGGQEGLARWILRMSPELRMGLDFDLMRANTFTTSIDIPIPALDPRLEVGLYYVEAVSTERFGNQGTAFRYYPIGNGTAKASGVVSGTTDFVATFPIMEEYDEIPYKADSNLALFVELRGMLAGVPAIQPDPTTYKLNPKATTLQMPLFEYHDPVDLSFVTSRSIELKAGPEGQERPVNPGRSVVYRFDLSYKGDFADSFELSLTGANSNWAHIIGDRIIKMQPGESRKLAIEVAAPSKAFAGDIADVTLTATSQANAAVQGGIRTLTMVVTDQDIPDESGDARLLGDELTDDVESPGLGLMALLCAFAVVASRRLRH